MKKTLLVTFGCSWTFGAGVGYTPTLTRDEYMNIAWDCQTCDNLIFQELTPRDLMSLLAKQHGLNDIDYRYHKSVWKKDTNRVDFLVSEKILNPYTYHPTKLGHQSIADMLAPFIEKLI